jgi:hypothetical protein
MKKTISVVVLMMSFLLGNGSSKKLLEANQERLKKDVTFLASTPEPRNYKNLKTLKEVTTYIRKIFEENSSHVETHTFKISQGPAYENIIASFGPREGDRFIIGAHYDVFGEYPGADDNASGVAAILEIARLLKEEKTPLKNRIDLVAFALEEPPFFASSDMGSAHYAKKIHGEKAKVKMMLALDMIGYFSDKKDSQKRPLPLMKNYPTTGNFISVVGGTDHAKETQKVKNLFKEGAPQLGVESVSAPTNIPGVDFSDHRNLWQYGYPGLMVTDTAFYRNPHYHTKSDKPETLDFKKMRDVVQALYYTAVYY